MAGPEDAFVAETGPNAFQKWLMKRYEYHRAHVHWPESNFPESAAVTPNVPRRVTSLKDPTIANYPISPNIEDRRFFSVDEPAARKRFWASHPHRRPDNEPEGLVDTSGFNPTFSDSLDRFRRDANASGFDIGIGSGYRSPERQAQLYDAAVAKYGSPEAARHWVAPPGHSMHNRGLAADLTFGSPAARAWAHQHAADYSLNFPMGHEPWHIEPVGIRQHEHLHLQYNEPTPEPRQQNLQQYPDANVGYPSGAPTEQPTERTYGSTTGDVIWKKVDPKTYYLYNKTEPEAKPQEEQPSTTREMMGQLAAQGTQTPEQALFMHDLVTHGAQAAIERAKRHLHIRQFAELNHDLRNDPNMDVQDRIQAMMDSGALRVDERGDLYTSVPLPPHANERILDASRRWQAPAESWYLNDQPTTSTPELEGSINQQMDQQTGRED